jgi:hypothetical protein
MRAAGPAWWSPAWGVHLIQWTIGMIQWTIGMIQWTICMIRWTIGMIQWTIGMLQWTISMIQWTIGMIQWTIGMIQWTIGMIQWTIGMIQWTFIEPALNMHSLPAGMVTPSLPPKVCSMCDPTLLLDLSASVSAVHPHRSCGMFSRMLIVQLNDQLNVDCSVEWSV